ncbi:MAG: carbohydrate ABC transporter permease [Candidatus Bathyarchaeia archaeon]
MSKMRGKSVESLFVHAIIAMAFLIILFPIAWLFLMSIKTPADNLRMPPPVIFKPTIINYLNSWLGAATFTEFGYGASERAGVTAVYGSSLALRNTIIIATLTTLITLILAIPAAYSFSRFRMRGKVPLQLYILMLRMAPPIAIILPLFLLFRWSGLHNTHIGIVLSHLTFILPFAIWLLKGFIDEVPKEIEEAAEIDGCSTFGIIWRIVFPIMKPSVTAVAILCFIFSWNEFLFASILSGPGTLTLTVLMTQYFVKFTVDWGAIAATGMISLIPTVIGVLLLQKYLVRGLTFGAVKG